MEGRAKRRGRYLDGNGLFLRVLDPAKRVYWVYRFRVGKRDREMSLGKYTAMTLADARARHAEVRAVVMKGLDPMGEKPGKAPATSSDAQTFGAAADDYVERKEKRGELGKNPKHRQQWRSTLAGLPKWFRDLPVDRIGAQQVFDVLDPIWAKTPETASRLRGRIAAVIDSTRGPEDERRNPAAWTAWMKDKLGEPKKLGKIDRLTGERVERSNHAAMNYKLVPALMAKLAATSGLAALALQITVLTATRTTETLGMTFDEIDFEEATWSIPPSPNEDEEAPPGAAVASGAGHPARSSRRTRRERKPACVSRPTDEAALEHGDGHALEAARPWRCHRPRLSLRISRLGDRDRQDRVHDGRAMSRAHGGE